MDAASSRLTRLQAAVRVDPAEEIFANKLCAVLGRAEIRDLVDRALEGLGLSLTDALATGRRKDGGLTPGELAWVAVADLDRRRGPAAGDAWRRMI